MQPIIPPQRVSPFTFSESYEPPRRPDDPRPQVQDAFRQTQFLLADELRLFAEGANLQLRIVAASSGSRLRTHPLAGLLGLWSRAFTQLADGLLLLTRGSYGSIPPLVRTAAECISAQESLRVAEMETYIEWLAGALALDEMRRATVFDLGRYFAGETLAANPRLKAVYRPASDLGRPNFGATLLLTGSDSNRTRVLLAFADQAFHFGWAQICLGWLLTLASVQLGVALHAREIFASDDEVRLAVHRWNGEVAARLDASDRCRIVEEEESRRYIVENFRRLPGGAPRRIVL